MVPETPEQILKDKNGCCLCRRHTFLWTHMSTILSRGHHFNRHPQAVRVAGVSAAAYPVIVLISMFNMDTWFFI